MILEEKNNLVVWKENKKVRNKPSHQAKKKKATV